MGAAAMPIALGASTGLNFLGGLFGGPKTTKIPAPAPLFPGTQESYVKALTDAGVAPAAFQTIAEGAKTGMPTDVGPAFEAMKSASQRGIAEGRSNLIEQFGVGGLRYGSDIMKAGVDYEAQTQKDFASILAGYTQQAQEAAANRRLQSAALGQQATGELATAFRPTAVVGGQSGLSQGLQAGGQGIMNFMMMKGLFPDLFQAGQTGGGFGDIVGNLPGSIGTGDVFGTPPFINPGTMAFG